MFCSKKYALLLLLCSAQKILSAEANLAHDSLDFLAKKSIEEFKEEEKKKKNKKKKYQALKPFTDCAVKLVEGQYGGSASIYEGMKFFDELYWFLKRGSEEDLILKTQKCMRSLNHFKKTLDKSNKKKFKKHTQITKENFLSIHKDLRTNYADSYKNINKILTKAHNPLFDCELKKSMHANIGCLMSLSLGFDTFTCKTPLGRRYRIIGPTYGLGVGLLSASVKMSQKKIKFYLPMSRKKILKNKYLGEAESFFFNDTKYQKNNDSLVKHKRFLLKAQQNENGMLSWEVKEDRSFVVHKSDDRLYFSLGLDSSFTVFTNNALKTKRSADYKELYQLLEL